jgi:F-type H+-transporting ATPase subunit delta
MAENVTLARPYAEAAFRAARETGRLDAWDQALERMASVAANADMQALIGNPNVSVETATGVFLDVVGTDISAEQKSFIELLAQNDRLAVLPEIRALFADHKNDVEGVKDAHIASAYPLGEAQIAELSRDLQRRFGCKIETTVAVDPTLIGGVRISVGDQVIDASIRGKLAQMASALKN